MKNSLLAYFIFQRPPLAGPMRSMKPLILSFERLSSIFLFEIPIIFQCRLIKHFSFIT